MRVSRFGLVLALGFASPTARADEERVALKDVPGVVREAVVSIADNGKIVSYEFEGAGLDEGSNVTVSVDGKTIRIGGEEDA